MKNIFVLNSVIRLIERNTAHAIRFARIGAALLLIAVGTLVFGACVLLTGTPLVVLFTAFVICSFIGSQLFGGAILVMEEDRRKQPTRRGDGNQDDMFYQRLIISYLEEFGSASRQDINKLLFTKLGDMLTDDEKNKKVGNLMTSLRREGRIFNAGSRRYPEWELKQGFSAE